MPDPRRKMIYGMPREQAIKVMIKNVMHLCVPMMRVRGKKQESTQAEILSIIEDAAYSISRLEAGRTL